MPMGELPVSSIKQYPVLGPALPDGRGCGNIAHWTDFKRIQEIPIWESTFFSYLLIQPNMKWITEPLFYFTAMAALKMQGKSKESGQLDKELV